MPDNARQAEFGQEPMPVTCAQCGEVTTTTIPIAGILSYVLGTLMVMFGCFCGCCLIPCMCCPSVMDVEHHCPKCRALLGRYKRL
ncbi:lipopolysaccharide-induced tumor necrosis factor-alpha factor homolog [Oppia nitens]|uniref:lipopolysaccharide-induced tumor necrosis factor-alpha factor homolog n=1 Tax=Oppia nitens TaxID=1686743 RepID=UPI0023DC2D7C|nr:lipopolysaccharide-induced tumor necrosis factor-alpha factor homolog [Oppia nitens]